MPLPTCATCAIGLKNPKATHCKRHVPHIKRQIFLTCRYCQNIFTTRPSNFDAKFCSRPCTNAGRQQIPWNKGLKGFMSGEQNSRWKGGISSSPEYNKISKSRRRARKKGNGGNYTLPEWRALKLFFNYMCLCCKKQEPLVKLTPDHIVPLSVGGRNDIANIQPLCMDCNMRKAAKTVDFRDPCGQRLLTRSSFLV